MASTNNMMGQGYTAQQAEAIVGNVVVAQTSAGSSAADATALNNADAYLLPTVGSGEGVIIRDTVPVKSELRIYNGGANALLVYPPTGCQINDGTASAAISVAAGKGALIARLSATQFGAVYA